MKKGLFFSLTLCISLIIKAQEEQVYVEYWDDAETIKRSEGKFKGGLEHGEWKYYYSDGQIQEERTYQFGRLDGPITTYFTNGNIEKLGYFEWNKPDSTFQAYFYSGNPKEK